MYLPRCAEKTAILLQVVWREGTPLQKRCTGGKYCAGIGAGRTLQNNAEHWGYHLLALCYGKGTVTFFAKSFLAVGGTVHFLAKLFLTVRGTAPVFGETMYDCWGYYTIFWPDYFWLLEVLYLFLAKPFLTDRALQTSNYPKIVGLYLVYDYVPFAFPNNNSQNRASKPDRIAGERFRLQD